MEHGAHRIHRIAASRQLIPRCIISIREYPGYLPAHAYRSGIRRASFPEMHVDGGVTAPVLTLPEAFLLRNAPLRPTPQATIYILMNDKIERDFRLVPDVTIDIVNRASESATKTLTRSILSETYKSARRNKLGFNLTYIEKDIQPQHSFGFETNYMKELYRYGLRRLEWERYG